MLLEDFNEKYGFQNRLLTFHPDENGRYYMIEKIDNKIFLYDMMGNLMQKEVRFQKGSKYSHNMIIKETKNYYIIENDFNFNMNGWNYARMALEYFIKKYNGRFYGNLIPNDYSKSISSNFFGQQVIPVCVFNSSKNEEKNIMQWHGDTEHNPVYAKMVENDPWIMFFKGNDDSSYYAHFKTCLQTVETWEMSRMNDNKMPERIEIPKKEKNLEEFYQLQTSQELFFFHQN